MLRSLDKSLNKIYKFSEYTEEYDKLELLTKSDHSKQNTYGGLFDNLNFIDTSNIRLADGSGVSRYNLTSSAQLNSLLSWMYKSEHKDDFLSTLPGGGWKNSTLEKRLINEGGLVRAKTGGLSGVRNLAGYITSQKHGDVAFSILMNGYTDSSSRYARIHDQILRTIIYD